MSWKRTGEVERYVNILPKGSYNIDFSLCFYEWFVMPAINDADCRFLLLAHLELVFGIGANYTRTLFCRTMDYGVLIFPFLAISLLCKISCSRI